jgi:hypothetical protein
MAPEQAEKPGEVDHRADIYSLGVVFYEMLTGELPGKLLEAPSKKVQIDVRLDEVVLRALERKPELRYQRAGDVKTMVETITRTRETRADMTDEQWEEHGKKVMADQYEPSEETRSKRERYLAMSLFSSPEAKEIALHMTDAEWKTMMRWGWFFGIWNAAICFLPFFILEFAPSQWRDWRVALAVVVVGLAAYPAWYKMLWHMQSDTEWARVRGIKPGSYPKFSFGKVFLWRDVGKAHSWRHPVARMLLMLVPLVAIVPAVLLWINLSMPGESSQSAWTSKSGRIVGTAPFVGSFSNGTVELLLLTTWSGEPLRNRLEMSNGTAALTAGPDSNTVCWKPDGTVSTEHFPGLEHFTPGARGIDIAVRVHGTSSTPVLKFNREVGSDFVSPYGLPDPKSLDPIFTAGISCPSNLLKMNVQVGLANGLWETKLRLLSSPWGQSGESRYEDGTIWKAGVQTEGSGDSDVAVAYHYSVNQEWETRFVGVDTDGNAVKWQDSGGYGIGTNLSTGLATVSRDQFVQIKQYQLQARKRQWVEFRNVSLEPGYHTKVEIVDARPGEKGEP